MNHIFRKITKIGDFDHPTSTFMGGCPRSTELLSLANNPFGLRPSLYLVMSQKVFSVEVRPKPFGSKRVSISTHFETAAQRNLSLKFDINYIKS